MSRRSPAPVETGHSGPFHARKLARFVLVGGASTLCQYAVLALLVELLGMKAALASCIGYGAGAVVNYAMNRMWTFKTNLSHAQNLSRFLVMVSLGFLLSYLLMHLLAESAGINYLLAQAITTAIVMLFNYLLAASWVFTKASS